MTRLNENAVYEVVEQRAAPQDSNVVADEVIFLPSQAEAGPEYFPRRVEIEDPEQGRLMFLTNHHKLGATTVALKNNSTCHAKTIGKTRFHLKPACSLHYENGAALHCQLRRHNWSSPREQLRIRSSFWAIRRCDVVPMEPRFSKLEAQGDLGSTRRRSRHRIAEEWRTQVSHKLTAVNSVEHIEGVHTGRYARSFAVLSTLQREGLRPAQVQTDVPGPLEAVSPDPGRTIKGAGISIIVAPSCNSVWSSGAGRKHDSQVKEFCSIQGSVEIESLPDIAIASRPFFG